MSKDWNEIVKLGNTPFTLLVDEVTDGEEYYFGYAHPENDDVANPVWRIKKMVKTGTVYVFKFADGNADFDNIWDDRTSLTYS